MTAFPRKRFAQHFLEPAWVAKVVQAIDPLPTQTFLEIGPGRGALTAPLAAAARRVIACEIDRGLAARLRMGAPANLTVVEGDFLKLSTEGFRRLVEPAGEGDVVRIAGNLPYNVASPIIFQLCRLYTAGVALRDATVMLQREVADRLTASPGTRDYSPLTILVGRRASVTHLLNLPPGAFRPAPKVHSALVRLQFKAPEPAARSEQVFERMVRAIFTRRRKMLANALRAFTGPPVMEPAQALAQAGLDGRRRPETLLPAELVRLADALTPPSVSGQAVL